MNLASFETEGFLNSGVSHRNHLGWRGWDYMMDSSRRFILRDDASAPIVKREDPANDVGERLTWLGQAREFILIKTLSVLPWGHWRQISHQSAPPSNRLFVITQILEETWPDPARVSRTWERGCLHVTWRPVSWQGWKTNALFTFTCRLKIILSLNLRQNRKNALGKSLKPQINLTCSPSFAFFQLISVIWLILKIWLL